MKHSEDLEKELRRQIEAEAEELLEEARREGGRRLQQARRERDRRREEFRRSLENDLAVRRRRSLAKTELEKKNQLLKARREEVDELFREARRRLEEMAREEPVRFGELLWGVYHSCRAQLPEDDTVRVRLGRGAGVLSERLEKEPGTEIERSEDFIGLQLEDRGGRVRWDGSLTGLLVEVRRDREADLEALLFEAGSDESEGQ